MAGNAGRVLLALERVQATFGGGAARRKRELLDALAAAPLRTAGQVQRLHEALCFLRAYADDRRLLLRVERMLRGFARRADLRRHREALADTGIAGTTITYPFFAPTARWLADRFGDRLEVDWDGFEHAPRLRRMIFLLAPHCETPPPDEAPLSTRQWVDRLRGPRETDAAFLIRRLAALPMDAPLRDWAYEELELPLRIRPGAGTPSRTAARAPGSPRAWQSVGLDRRRPDLRRAARRRPLRVEAVSPARGRRLIALARESMVTRSRDLDVFASGDPADVRLLHWEDGLQFACIGLRPEGRFLLEAVYGFLTLKNGIPIGYVLASGLFRSSEIAYNVFETWRGGEAARIYARVLASVRHLLGADTFAIDPYQLGHGNEEGLASGAWWFYRKLGFAPRDPATLRLARAEEARMRARPGHRSRRDMLERLAREPLFLHLENSRDDVLGLLPLGRLGLNLTGIIAERFGSDVEGARRALSRDAAVRLGVASLRGLNVAERRAWERWSPLVVLLPGLERWTPPQRRSLFRIIRAKAGRRESDYLRLLDRHPRLRPALLRLAEGRP